MALFEENHSGFYNSVEHDRVYTAEDIGKMFDGILTDGIFQWFGEAFVPTVEEGTNRINIGRGRAWFIKHWIHYETGTTIEIPATDLNNPRYDAVVLYVDNNDDIRAGGIKVVTGTPSSEPRYPTMTKIEGVHEEYPICYVYVPSNYGAYPILTAANVKDVRGSSSCPWAQGLTQSSKVNVTMEARNNFSSIPLDRTTFCRVNYKNSSDPQAPITTTFNDAWWNVLTISANESRRVTQIAFWVFSGHRDTIYFRQKHDTVWHGWYSVSISELTTMKNNITAVTNKANTNTTNIATINTKLTTDEAVLTNLGIRTDVPIPTSDQSTITIPAATSSGNGIVNGNWFTITKALSGISILTASFRLNPSSGNTPTKGWLGFEIEYRANSSASSTVVSLRQYAGFSYWSGGSVSGNATVSGCAVVSLPENSQIRYRIINATDKSYSWIHSYQGGNFCRLAHLK